MEYSCQKRRKGRKQAGRRERRKREDAGGAEAETVSRLAKAADGKRRGERRERGGGA